MAQNHPTNSGRADGKKVPFTEEEQENAFLHCSQSGDGSEQAQHQGFLNGDSDLDQDGYYSPTSKGRKTLMAPMDIEEDEEGLEERLYAIAKAFVEQILIVLSK